MERDATRTVWDSVNSHTHSLITRYEAQKPTCVQRVCVRVWVATTSTPPPRTLLLWALLSRHTLSFCLSEPQPCAGALLSSPLVPSLLLSSALSLCSWSQCCRWCVQLSAATFTGHSLLSLFSAEPSIYLLLLSLLLSLSLSLSTPSPSSLLGNQSGIKCCLKPIPTVDPMLLISLSLLRFFPVQVNTLIFSLASCQPLRTLSGLKKHELEKGCLFEVEIRHCFSM